MSVDEFGRIEGRTVNEDVFKDFALKETLMDYDGPLLVLAESPDRDKWLFKWCDATEEPSSVERWIAFKVSESRLESLRQNRISLLEVATLPEEKFLYVLEAKSIFEPIRVKISFPEKLPNGYLPYDDVTVDGNLRKLQADKQGRLALKFHIFQADIEEGKAPFSIIGPLQANFQRYMTWAAHTLNRTPMGRVPSALRDWATLHLAAIGAGSFRMECTSNSNPEQSEKLSKACELLASLSDGNFNQIESIRQQVGDDALYFAYMLAQFISSLDLSISMRWISSNTPRGYLALDKRRADNFIAAFQPAAKYDRTITIYLTDEEAEPIRRDVNGKGGMQNLLKGLQTKLNTDNSIQLTPAEIEKILRYGLNYGQGGFQNRLVGIARALRRVGASFQTS